MLHMYYYSNVYTRTKQKLVPLFNYLLPTAPPLSHWFYLICRNRKLLYSLPHQSDIRQRFPHFSTDSANSFLVGILQQRRKKKKKREIRSLARKRKTAATIIRALQPFILASTCGLSSRTSHDETLIRLFITVILIDPSEIYTA